MINYITPAQASTKWNITDRRISTLCREGRIPGAKMVGKRWMIPEFAQKPLDGRSERYKKSPRPYPAPLFTSIDLFSGPGGLATGFLWAGIKPLIAIEWSYWTAQTYAKSHDAEIFDLSLLDYDSSALQPFLKPSEKTLLIYGDINKVSNNLLLEILKKRFGVETVDIVTGGAPCESFSMAGNRKEEDDRNLLYQNILRIARAVNSKMFIFENVKGLFSKKMNGKSGEMYKKICEEFESPGDSGEASYSLVSTEKKTVLLKAVDYGVPQKRERLFLVGLNKANKNLRFSYPEKTHGPHQKMPYVTVGDALLDLPKLGVGCEATKYVSNSNKKNMSASQNLFLRRMRGDLSLPLQHAFFEPDRLTNHKAPGHTAKMQARIKNIKPGENMKTSAQRLAAEGKEDVVSRYFPKKIYAARNRRLRPDEPSFTVTSHCLDEMIHPTQNRGLSPREAARLQSFPDWYVFEGPYTKFHSDPEQDQYEQIGDAIPPLLAYALAEEAVKTLSTENNT